jgi:hypothetical protein
LADGLGTQFGAMPRRSLMAVHVRSGSPSAPWHWGLLELISTYRDTPD